MLDQGVTPEQSEGELVEFATAGSSAAGEFHCADCGYGVTVQVRLPVCPMCGGDTWAKSVWSTTSSFASWPL